MELDSELPFPGGQGIGCEGRAALCATCGMRNAGRRQLVQPHVFLLPLPSAACHCLPTAALSAAPSDWLVPIVVYLPAVQGDWDATISRDRPQLKESGIEHLTIEFV